jgi:predicted AAA+ superfamily ATPase
MVKENGMDVMRKKETVNQSINLSDKFASWLMMMMVMLKGYVEDAQKSRVKHEAARRKLWFFFLFSCCSAFCGTYETNSSVC